MQELLKLRLALVHGHIHQGSSNAREVLAQDRCAVA